MIDESRFKPLPIVHARRERRPADLFKVELEFSNGERRTYERLISRSPDAVIIAAIPDHDHALLIRDCACGLHRY